MGDYDYTDLTDMFVSMVEPIAVSRRDAARLLDISPKMLDRLIARGVIRTRQFSEKGRVMISVESLHELMGDKKRRVGRAH